MDLPLQPRSPASLLSASSKFSALRTPASWKCLELKADASYMGKAMLWSWHFSNSLSTSSPSSSFTVAKGSTESEPLGWGAAVGAPAEALELLEQSCPAGPGPWPLLQAVCSSTATLPTDTGDGRTQPARGRSIGTVPRAALRKAPLPAGCVGGGKRLPFLPSRAFLCSPSTSPFSGCDCLSALWGM